MRLHGSSCRVCVFVAVGVCVYVVVLLFVCCLFVFAAVFAFVFCCFRVCLLLSLLLLLFLCLLLLPSLLLLLSAVFVSVWRCLGLRLGGLSAVRCSLGALWGGLLLSGLAKPFCLMGFVCTSKFWKVPFQDLEFQKMSAHRPYLKSY